MKFLKKSLSLILVLSMLLGFMPLGLFQTLARAADQVSITVQVGKAVTADTIKLTTEDVDVPKSGTVSENGQDIFKYEVETKTVESSGLETIAGEAVDISKLSAGASITCKIGDETHYIKVNGTTLDNAGSFEEASAFTITKNNDDTYFVSIGGKYLTGAHYSLSLEEGSFAWTLAADTGLSFNLNGYPYYITFSNGWTSWNAGDKNIAYAAETSTGEKTTTYHYTPTFTGVAKGEGTVEIAGVTYNVTVTEESTEPTTKPTEPSSPTESTVPEEADPVTVDVELVVDSTAPTVSERQEQGQTKAVTECTDQEIKDRYTGEIIGWYTVKNTYKENGDQIKSTVLDAITKNGRYAIRESNVGKALSVSNGELIELAEKDFHSLTWWNFTLVSDNSEDGFYVSAELNGTTYFLCIDDNATLSLKEKGDSFSEENATVWKYGKFKNDGAATLFTDSYALAYDNGWCLSTGTKWNQIKVEDLTFSRIYEPTTTFKPNPDNENGGVGVVEVGSVTYNVYVTGKYWVEPTLNADKFITNSHMGEGGTGGNCGSNAKVTVSASETHQDDDNTVSSISSEEGMLFENCANIVSEGENNGFTTVYWHGTKHPYGDHQVCRNKDFMEGIDGKTNLLGSLDSKGNGDAYASSDKTKGKNAVEFKYIRYYEGRWAVSNDRKNWEYVLSNDQLVARYNLKTTVTEAVTTLTQDWGVPNSDSADQGGTTWVQLDFAVSYESGNYEPTWDKFPISEKTVYYHAHEGQDKVTQAEGMPTLRRLDTIIGQETSYREVYMITVTHSSDIPTTEITSETEKPIYKGEEKIVWLKDADQNFPDRFTFDAAHFIWGTRPADDQLTAFESKYGSRGFDADANTTYTEADSSGVPYVDYVEAYNHQGVLVTYYLKAKNLEGNLRVHYRLWNTDLETSLEHVEDFHSYQIVPADGAKFSSDFAIDRANSQYLLKNNSVEAKVSDSAKQTLYVTGVLSQMPNIDSQYLTGKYQLYETYVSENGEDVYLFYTENQLERYIVADFGLPMTIDWEHVFVSGLSESADNVSYALNYLTVDDKVINDLESQKIGTIAMGKEQGKGYDSFTFTPTQVINSKIEIDVKLSVNITRTVDNEDKTTTEELTCAVYILPATTVYYEPVPGSFVTAGNGWTASGGSPSGKQGTYAILREQNNYGYDPAYVSSTQASGGYELKSNGAAGSVDFYFTGTGVELYANCSANSGRLMAVVYKRESGATEYTTPVRLCMVDTKVGGGASTGTSFQTWGNAYNVPVVSLRDLERGDYKLSVYEIRRTDETRDDGISIDGFRVTLPMDNDNVKSAYAINGEKDPQFWEVRDIALASVTFPENMESQYKDDLAKNINSQVQGKIESDKISAVVVKNTSAGSLTGEDEVKVDVLNNGPKNELYLSKDETLILSVSQDYTYQIGLKSVGGNTSYKFNGAESDTALDSTTDMFYKIDRAEDDTISVTNTGVGTLSITKLKCIPNAGTSSSDETEAAVQAFTPETMARAVLRFAPAVSDKDDDVTPPTDPMPSDPPKTEPEEPKTTEPETTEPKSTEPETTDPKPTDPPATEPEAPKPTEPAAPVKDVAELKDVKPTAWYFEAVKFVAARGIMTGVAEDRFQPEAKLTRAMMVKLLYAYEGAPENDGKSAFRDVSSNAWYAKAVRWAADNGIVNGTSATTFDPGDSITREQMVTILYRYAQYKELDPKAGGDLAAFPDRDRVSSWAEDALRWAVDAGIIQGSDGKLLPKGTATRAQVAKVLQSFVEKVAEA